MSDRLHNAVHSLYSFLRILLYVCKKNLSLESDYVSLHVLPHIF